MTNELPVKVTNAQLEKFSAFLGAAPVLNTEDGGHYNEIWQRLIECFTPADFMELLPIRQLQNETWKILRYRVLHQNHNQFVSRRAWMSRRHCQDPLGEDGSLVRR